MRTGNKRVMVTVILMAACSGEQDVDRWTSVNTVGVPEQSPRGVGLTVELSSALSPGLPALWTIRGAGDGETVYLVGTDRGAGDGPCPPVIGGNCMGILAPLRVMATGTAGADGSLELLWNAPPSVPIGLVVSVQAAIIRGAGGLESVTSNVVNATIEEPSPALDIDRDRLDFGTAPIDCAVSLDLTMTSDGESPLVVEDILLPPELTADLPPLPLTLTPGSSEVVTFTWEAEAEGALRGVEVDILSNDRDVLLSVFATGDETAACTGVMGADLSYEALMKVGDVTIVMDTTCSMGETLTAMSEEFVAIVDELTLAIPDLTIGLATYQDYNDASFGSGEDKPFTLVVQQTTDFSAVDAALGSLAPSGGADGPESTIEALYQAISGGGYDQDCDGVFDEEDDVFPFVANPLDAFGGAVVGTWDPTVPGTGELGGMGYRMDVSPVLIYATDNEIRDPDAGDATPGGCHDAGTLDLVEVVEASNAKIMGIGTSLVGDYLTEMEELALAIGSAGDFDGDGVLDPAVTTWTTGSEAFRAAIVTGVNAVTRSEDFGKLEILPYSDELGLLVDVEPQVFYSVPGGTTLDFRLFVDGTLTEDPAAGELVTVALIANDTTLLDTIDVYVIP